MDAETVAKVRRLCRRMLERAETPLGTRIVNTTEDLGKDAHDAREVLSALDAKAARQPSITFDETLTAKAVLCRLGCGQSFYEGRLHRCPSDDG